MARINDKSRELAKELYLQTNKTQEQIADIVKVGRLTVNKWALKGEWKAIKEAQQQTPERVIQALYAEVEQLNKAIRERPEGQRFANSKESDARNKIILSIGRMKTQIALPQYVSVLVKFIDYVQANNLELSKSIVPLMNEFLNEQAQHLTKHD